jgi:HPt (histidine-containing phosphotransfer) domain-containing protein
MADEAVIAIDPDIIDLAENFLRKRRASLPQLRALIAENGMERLRGMGHELKGTAGSYGFAELSRAGAELEAAAIEEDPDRAREAVERMAAFLERVTLVAR